MNDEEKHRRAAASAQAQRDLKRLEARPPDDHFWEALRLVGGVGWPVAVLTLVGAGAGHLLGGGPRLTAACIAIGAALGGLSALSALRRTSP